MEDVKQTAILIRHGDYGVTLDISKAYHHVPVSLEMRKFLAFQFEGNYYAYKGVPFGVSTAPRIFSAIMHHCTKLVRQIWGVRCIQYLDDWILLHRQRTNLKMLAQEIVQFLQKMGWLVNQEKSVLRP
jgi:hypothetical protein